MEANAHPDRETVAAAVEEIRTSPDDHKDELLHRLLCLAYPTRAGQDG